MKDNVYVNKQSEIINKNNTKIQTQKIKINKKDKQKNIKIRYLNQK